MEVLGVHFGHDEGTAEKHRHIYHKRREECASVDEVQAIQVAENRKSRDGNVEYQNQEFCSWDIDLTKARVAES